MVLANPTGNNTRASRTSGRAKPGTAPRAGRNTYNRGVQPSRGMPTSIPKMSKMKQ